ncbi:MAG: CHAT domain-containing protein [Lewinella sp.]
MQVLKLLFVVAVAVCIASCGGGASHDKTATGAQHILADSLADLRAAYADLRLPEALARARRLRTKMEGRGDVPDDLKVEAYQYLAMLHFDHGRYTDSIGIFVEKANGAMPNDAGIELASRQLLCEAYEGYHDWAWLQMDMQASLGQSLLRQDGRTETELFGLLLLVQAQARKQHGHVLADGSREQQLAWKTSGTLFADAVRLFARLHSPREDLARLEEVILWTRFPERDVHLRKMIRAVTPEIYRDRLLGYWHMQRGNQDSAVEYYRRVVANPDQFDSGFFSEAYYMIKMAALANHRYEEALLCSRRDMILAGCCPPEDATGVDDCFDRPVCGTYLAAQAKIYLEWYTTFGRSEHLQQALRLAMDAVSGYESLLRDGVEEAKLNQMLVMGRRIIEVAQESAFTMFSRDTCREDLSLLLHSMESGKALLLYEAVRDAVTHNTDDIKRSLEADINLLKATYSRQYHITRDELVHFAAINQQLRRTIADPGHRQKFSIDTTDVTVDRISEVQAELSDRQAFIEFAEVPRQILVLYIDRDTAFAYAVSDSIKPMVVAFQHLLQGKPVLPVEYAALGYGVFKGLLGPVAPLVTRRQEMLIVPSASLDALSFAALVTSVPETAVSYTDLHYLVDHWSIRYIPNWRTERAQAGRRQAVNPMASTFGTWTNPDLSGYLGNLADNLITRSAPGGNHYRDGQCNSSTFLANASRFDILHLSVHAQGTTHRLYDTHLHLNQTDSLNGVTIGIQSLKARLVVLAACSTARGFARPGEGTFSLTRSFHLAGVPEVVASQYNIPALATAEILRVFYASLWRGTDTAQSLAEAQRACRYGKLTQRWTWPGYWGGLVLT